MDVKTLITAIPTLPIAIPNKTYAINNASSPNTLLPRLLDKSLSLPIVLIICSVIPFSSSSLLLLLGLICILSFPVPNDAPTAIRDQNSYVAHKNGIIPIIKIIIFVDVDKPNTSDVCEDMVVSLLLVISERSMEDDDNSNSSNDNGGDKLHDVKTTLFWMQISFLGPTDDFVILLLDNGNNNDDDDDDDDDDNDDR